MPIVHHAIPTFTGREVVAGVALDFASGSANVDHLSAAAAAIATAVKGWTITGDVPAPSKRKRPTPPADTDIHAADDEPLAAAEPDIYDNVPIEDEA